MAVEGKLKDAIIELERAVKLEDELSYFEPPTWYYPTRQSLGAVLLQAGKSERAEAIYRQDLVEFPANGWSLFGLMKALQRQDKAEKAKEVERQFREVWRYADTVLTASRF